MKPFIFTLRTTIAEEIDEVLYGGFYAFSRIHSDSPDQTPYVQTRKDGPWIPVKDWKAGDYQISPDRLRDIARHFIEIGRRLKEDGE